MFRRDPGKPAVPLQSAKVRCVRFPHGADLSYYEFVNQQFSMPSTVRPLLSRIELNLIGYNKQTPSSSRSASNPISFSHVIATDIISRNLELSTLALRMKLLCWAVTANLCARKLQLFLKVIEGPQPTSVRWPGKVLRIGSDLGPAICCPCSLEVW